MRLHDKRITAKRPAQMALYIVLLVIVILLMMSLRWCSTPPAGMQKIIRPSEGDTIDVAISYSPMTLYRYADTLGGFSYDMLRELAAPAGLELKFHPVTSTTKALDGLKSGLFDLVVSDMARTSDLDSMFVFSADVYLDKQVLIQRCGPAEAAKAITSQLDFGGREVWVEAGSPAYMRLRNLSHEIGDTITIHADAEYTSEQLFLLVAVGDIPCAVINETVARRMAGDYPDVDITTAVSFTQFQGWVMRSSDTGLRAAIDSAIVTYRNTASYSRLADRYGLQSPF